MNGPFLSPIGPSARRQSISVKVGHVTIGGGVPIVVQSMTNTDTADVTGTADQVAQLARAGSEIVRITVDRKEAAAAVPYIRDELDRRGVNVPLVGDFHYIGHSLLTEFPACAEALAKYRINPGNVGKGANHDKNFATMVQCAVDHDKPVRIGVNAGSLDQELLNDLMETNASSSIPQEAQTVFLEAMVQSALRSAAAAEELGLKREQIILSCKISKVQELLAATSAFKVSNDAGQSSSHTSVPLGFAGQ